MINLGIYKKIARDSWVILACIYLGTFFQQNAENPVDFLKMTTFPTQVLNLFIFALATSYVPLKFCYAT